MLKPGYFTAIKGFLGTCLETCMKLVGRMEWNTGMECWNATTENVQPLKFLGEEVEKWLRRCIGTCR